MQKIPSIPALIKGRPFQLFAHQEQAISNWINAGYHGLFKLATGAGKTLTSICALVRLYESRAKIDLSTFVVITVPYIELANQWIQELTPFNITAIPCYDGKNNWSCDLENKIIRYKSGGLNFLCCVVVNKTFVSAHFTTQLNKVNLDQILFIGDECHHLGGEYFFANLPLCSYRIGLSATPYRLSDDEVDDIENSTFPDMARRNLLSYFNQIVFDYSLSDAIHDGILAEYNYDLVAVYLTSEEQDQYEEYSVRITKIILSSKGQKLKDDEHIMLTNLCNARSRLIATCSGKLPALINYLKIHSELSMAHSLVYVGEGKAPGDEQPYILKVTNALHDKGLKVAKFTATEGRLERKQIMDNFKNNHIDTLVAMKVLDEGIDVPVCRSAFILASSRNPRQYIQRRGRVLRKAAGKDSALIVDFVVLPYNDIANHFSQKLRNAERERVEDFMLTALNSAEIERRIIDLGIM